MVCQKLCPTICSPTMSLVSQPPNVFYNDPKTRTFSVTLMLKGTLPHTSEKIPLKYVLLYEHGALVDNQSTLERKDDNPSMLTSNRESTFQFRINQVSSRHLNRKFKIVFEASNLKVETTPIEVRSKVCNKRKQARDPTTTAKSIIGSMPKATKRPRSAPSHQPHSHSAQLHEAKDVWIKLMRDKMKQICWQPIGFESTVLADGQEVVDKSRRIYRCLFCQQVSLGSDPCGHKPGCEISALIEGCPVGDARENQSPAPNSVVFTGGSVSNQVIQGSLTQWTTYSSLLTDSTSSSVKCMNETPEFLPGRAIERDSPFSDCSSINSQSSCGNRISQDSHDTQTADSPAIPTVVQSDAGHHVEFDLEIPIDADVHQFVEDEFGSLLDPDADWADFEPVV